MRLLAVLTVCLMLPACVLAGGRRDPEPAGLEPTFVPIETTTSARLNTTSTSTTGDTSASTTTVTDVPLASPRGPEVTPPVTSASLSDRRGDVTISAERPPDWADLLSGTLIRSVDGFELRVGLGGEVPSTYDGDHTINIASFYDVNGDGNIDYEVWVNLASGGWGGSYFDNTRRGGNRLNDDALVIEPQANELVVRFPLTHLADAEQFRWALASEWGRYEVIGTAAAARDDAPDNDGAADFPGSTEQ